MSKAHEYFEQLRGSTTHSVDKNSCFESLFCNAIVHKAKRKSEKETVVRSFIGFSTGDEPRERKTCVDELPHLSNHDSR
jgi:hypothetical protein